MGLKRKSNYGIQGYDPNKRGKEYAVVQHQCPHCWFSHRSKSVLTRHVNAEHWDLRESVTP